MSQYWDDPSRDYRKRYKLPDQFIWDRSDFARIDLDGYVSILIELLPPPPQTVLDAGCGPGFISNILVTRGYEVTGIDFNETAIGYAKLLVDGVRFHTLDLRDMVSATEFHGKFDVVVCMEVLEHIPPRYRGQVLQGLYLSLRTGGKLVASVPSPLFRPNPWDYRRPELGELEEIISSAGLVVKRVTYQHRRSILFSRFAWRLIENRYYDLKFMRHLLGWWFHRELNITNDPGKAGRFVIDASKDA